MLAENILTGATLPDKTVCFTFDDGPGQPTFKNKGPKTLEVAISCMHAIEVVSSLVSVYLVAGYGRSLGIVHSVEVGFFKTLTLTCRSLNSCCFVK